MVAVGLAVERKFSLCKKIRIMWEIFIESAA